MKIAVSYISSPYDEEYTISLIERSNADYIHVDLMDGIYVDNKNFTVEKINQLFKNVGKKLDVHLMVDQPEQYLNTLKELNVECITFHPGTTTDPIKLINDIKNANLKVGIAINPEEDVSIFLKYFPLIDHVLIMSVVPGKGGQQFMDMVIPKLHKLQELKKEYDFLIAIDGGINDQTIRKVSSVDLAISGSFICYSNDYNKAIDLLKVK